MTGDARGAHEQQPEVHVEHFGAQSDGHRACLLDGRYAWIKRRRVRDRSVSFPSAAARRSVQLRQDVRGICGKIGERIGVRLRHARHHQLRGRRRIRPGRHRHRVRRGRPARSATSWPRTAAPPPKLKLREIALT